MKIIINSPPPSDILFSLILSPCRHTISPEMSSKEFETALRSHLHSKFLSQLPPHFLKIRVGDFLQLAGVEDKENFNYHQMGIETTPKTATRRSLRQSANSTLATITKTVKRSLFSLTTSTPSKQPTLKSHQLVPKTPSVPPPQTPHLTIKSSTAKQPPISVVKPHGPISHTPSKRYKQLPPSQTPKTQTTQSSLTSPATGIVQFQLQDGQVIDVDFSRSPKSALTHANLIGSEAIGEVKAKIETYANQFMQYLKFFKKFKPN